MKNTTTHRRSKTIRCGHCHDRHNTAQDVWECAQDHFLTRDLADEARFDDDLFALVEDRQEERARDW